MFDNCMTEQVKLKTDSQNLTFKIMEEENATVREFLRNYKKFAKKKKIIIILNNGKPQGAFIPYEEWKKEQNKEFEKISLADAVEEYAIKGGPKNLSERVDEIAYNKPNSQEK